jgi:hypothetical protein
MDFGKIKPKTNFSYIGRMIKIGQRKLQKYFREIDQLQWIGTIFYPNNKTSNLSFKRQIWSKFNEK